MLLLWHDAKFNHVEPLPWHESFKYLLSTLDSLFLPLAEVAIL